MTNTKKPHINTDELLSLYNKGLSTSQIAKQFEMNKTSVSRRLKKSGVILRKSKDYAGSGRYWLWKGDNYIDPITRKRNQRLHRKWSLAVRDRDGHRCQHCNKTHNRLMAHHIVSLRECLDTKLEFDTQNGITLCPKCHKNIHKNP